MFVLSQDELNMDLDRDSLELMLNLLESDVSHKSVQNTSGLTKQQLEKNKIKVRELCEEIKTHGKATHLNLDKITVFITLVAIYAKTYKNGTIYVYRLELWLWKLYCHLHRNEPVNGSKKN